MRPGNTISRGHHSYRRGCPIRMGRKRAIIKTPDGSLSNIIKHQLALQKRSPLFVDQRIASCNKQCSLFPCGRESERGSYEPERRLKILDVRMDKGSLPLLLILREYLASIDNSIMTFAIGSFREDSMLPSQSPTTLRNHESFPYRRDI